MSVEYEKLIEEHREQMKNLFAVHEERMALATQTFQESIAKAEEAFRVVVEDEAKEPEPPKQAPQAVWIKASDGEEMLMLNREAAIMQMALLDRLAEVLAELTNITKKRTAAVR